MSVQIIDNSRRASGHACACGAAVIGGIDADVAALNAICDPRPLSRQGELMAVVAGRAVYEIHDRRLHRRDRWALRSPCRNPVLAAHRCGDPLPAAWLAPPVTRRPTAPSTEPEF